MARIKTYPINFDIHPKDIIIGTDKSDFDKTKNFRVETLKEFFTTDVDFGQNNLVREYFIGFAQDKTELGGILNNTNLTVNEDENVIVTYFTQSSSNPNVWVQVMLWWKKGKGVYSPIGSTDFTGKFIQLPVVFPTEENVNELITAPDAVVYDYGTITVPIWQAINETNPPVDYSDVTKIYYVKAKSNDIDFLFVFNGDNGLYGVGELQAIDDDLILLFSSEQQGDVVFDPQDYDLADFTNESSDPFVRESELPTPIDQDNLPIKIDLTLADLGITELGTDVEMNDALKAYFLENNLTVGEKQILDIRIFDELSTLVQPYLILEFDDIEAFGNHYGINVNSLSEWTSLIGGNFQKLTINENTAILEEDLDTNPPQEYTFDADEEFNFTFLRYESFGYANRFLVDINGWNSNVIINVDMTDVTHINTNNNAFTASRFDENFAEFATNTLVTEGILTAIASAEDLSQTTTVTELTAKNWIINID
jgi:hypothetical protein